MSNSNNNNSSSSSSNTLGQILFGASIGTIAYLIWKNKKYNTFNETNYYMIHDLSINPSPFYIRKNNDKRINTSTSPLAIDNKTVRNIVKEKISSPSSSSTLNTDSTDKETLSNFSSPQSSRNRRKTSTPRPTVHAPNPRRNKEKDTNVITAVNTTSSQSSPITDDSITSSNVNFYDIVSPISDLASPTSFNDEPINETQSTNFDTPQSGPNVTPYQNQVKILTTDEVNKDVDDWISPLFADVMHWVRDQTTGMPIYVLECKTTKGPVLEWTVNKTYEQFNDLKNHLNSLLDIRIDIDLDGIYNNNNNNNNNDDDDDTQLWSNCSILSKFMMTIIIRQDIMKKMSTFHLVTDFLDPDN